MLEFHGGNNALESKEVIRIFVTTHKAVDVPESNILQPVQVGNKTPRFAWACQDDEGENIAEKNPMYCELTTQYWAWKNVDAQYYGFCHYRRYFNFSSTVYEENDFGEVMDDFIDKEACSLYGLDDESIRKEVEGFDVITTPVGDLTKIIHGYGTPISLWAHAPKLVDRDLQTMYRIIADLYPDYAQDAKDFLNGHFSCFCNMFIMRKDIFFAYNEWLFPILERFEEVTDMSDYSKEALRTPGHLAERLLNIYLMHHKRIGTNWKMKELQCVHFTNPEPIEHLDPLELGDPMQKIIPVVFAADDAYVPQLTTTIYSALKNASAEYHYDVVILQKDIQADKQRRMKDFFAQFENATIRFINVFRHVAQAKLSTNNAHISIETYYRFLIQDILPYYNKVLYLDSDLIIEGDIADLFEIAIDGYALAAAKDIDFAGNVNNKDGKRLQYAHNVLGMKNPLDYFQAGVLVMNTHVLRTIHSLSQWLKLAENPEYIYNDQDVLNSECEGRVLFLDSAWNVMHNCDGRVENVFSFAPNSIFDSYQESRNNPLIIHYAGFEKPWSYPNCDFASVYWKYARQTPFYERLLNHIVSQQLPGKPLTAGLPARALGEGNPLRKVVDPLLPLGSRRREVMKSLGRKVTHK